MPVYMQRPRHASIAAARSDCRAGGASIRSDTVIGVPLLAGAASSGHWAARACSECLREKAVTVPSLEGRTLRQCSAFPPMHPAVSGGLSPECAMQCCAQSVHMDSPESAQAGGRWRAWRSWDTGALHATDSPTQVSDLLEIVADKGRPATTSSLTHRQAEFIRAPYRGRSSAGKHGLAAEGVE